MTELKKALPGIIKILEVFKQKGLIKGYALIGGMAVAVRGFLRATKDLDFLINTDDDFFRKEFARDLEARGYTVKVYRGDLDDPLRGLIRILDDDENPLIDLMLVYTKWQEDIVNAAQEIKIGEVFVPIAKVEDLVILKLKAGGPQDLLDARELVKVISLTGQLDKLRLSSLAKRAGIDRKLQHFLK